MTSEDIAVDPSHLMIDAKRLVRMAGGLPVLLLGLVVIGSVACGLSQSKTLALLVLVYLLAPIWVRRWRARRGWPDIRSSLVVSEGRWWRWQGSNESVWRIHPIVGLLIIAVTFGAKVLLERLLEAPRGISGDWIVLAIALNYLLIYRALSMIEDLVMAIGLGLLALVMMVRPTPMPEHMENIRFWNWGVVGMLMAVTGTIRHLRWRRWVAAHQAAAS